MTLFGGAMHVRAMRVLRGVDLRFALQPPDVFAAVLARVIAALTFPFHALAGKLVYPKAGWMRGAPGLCPGLKAPGFVSA